VWTNDYVCSLFFFPCVHVHFVCAHSILVCITPSSKPPPGMLTGPPRNARICRVGCNYNQSQGKATSETGGSFSLQHPTAEQHGGRQLRLLSSAQSPNRYTYTETTHHTGSTMFVLRLVCYQDNYWEYILKTSGPSVCRQTSPALNHRLFRSFDHMGCVSCTTDKGNMMQISMHHHPHDLKCYLSVLRCLFFVIYIFFHIRSSFALFTKCRN